jgi:phosphate transport system permease protein
MSVATAQPLPPTAPASQRDLYRPRLAFRRFVGLLFQLACILLSLVALVVLVTLIGQIFYQGWGVLTFGFVTGLPSFINPAASGVWPALCGTLWLIVLTAVIAIPLGVGAGVYLEEYARKSALSRLISLNIENLAGVPSVVYGLLGLALFVRWAQFDRSIIAGALTLALLVLPVIIIASREALRAVPDSIRQAAFGLGATRWQCVRHHVLPAALPGIMTGVILALSRAIGEAAPLVLIGALAYITSVPGEGFADYMTPEEGQSAGLWLYLNGSWMWARDTLTSPFTALPIQTYRWTEEAHQEFHALAGGAIIVLLAILLSMNAVAVGIRAWNQRSRQW